MTPKNRDSAENTEVGLESSNEEIHAHDLTPETPQTRENASSDLPETSPMSVRQATARGNTQAAAPSSSAGQALYGEDNEGALEWHAPTLVRTDESTTIPYLLERRVQRYPKRPIIAIKREISDSWQHISASEFYDQVMSVAAGLIGLGLQPGDMVAIMSRTRYEWTLLDFGCWFAGLVPLPIYETSSLAQIEYILRDTGAKAIVTETITQAELARAAAERAQMQWQIFSLDTEAMTQIQEAGAGVSRKHVNARTAQLTAETIATIIYTSGTTGNPKGVVLTHGNFATLAVNGHAWMPEVAAGEESRLLLFLPLAHGFARFLQVFQLSGNGVLGHTPNTRNLLSDLASFKPSYVMLVPRVLEKIYNSADGKALASGKQKIFRWAARVSVEYSKACRTEAGPSRKLKAQRRIADKLVYAKLIRLLGGNVKFVISGGAPLSEYLAHFYTGMGLPVLEGYGLTETVAPLAVNTPRLNKIGTVGPPIPPIAIRIADDGEIQIKGPSVFVEYHNQPEATAEAFTEDGWLKTGDLGSLDRDGYLRITGRAKDLIITAGGKNVSPAALEDPLRQHPLISQVVVIGDRRPFISALITLDEEMLPLWLKNHGLPPMSAADAATNIEVLASLDRAVEEANEHVSRAESIRKIRVLTTDFTEANGILTPSLKVKRAVVHERFADIIEEIYTGPAEG